jgi:Xaa-Pro aminopeptidase
VSAELIAQGATTAARAALATAAPAAPAPVERSTRLRAAMQAAGLHATLVTGSAGKRYFAGFVLQQGEEWTSGYSGALIVTPDSRILLADARYTEQAMIQAPGWEVRRTRKSIGEELAAIFDTGGIRRCGAEAEVLSHADWAAIREANPATELVPIDEPIRALRLIKDVDERMAIARACALTDACFDHLLEAIAPPMTEREIAWEIEAWFRSHGAEAIAFEPGVLVGARASMPHGHPSDARLGLGDALLLDFGCQVDGYRSDMTRTIFAGEPSDDWRRLHGLVRSAQDAAYAALAVGASGTSIDAAARAVIADAGLGEAFTHGLGHGIGLETHEEPRLLTWDRPLDAGMVFTLEPGIYLPGQIGIRIEDDVALGADGPQRLTRSSRDVIVI